MSETSASQQPNDEAGPPAPRPGLRLRAPGAAPRLPDEESAPPANEPTTAAAPASAAEQDAADRQGMKVPGEKPKPTRPRKAAAGGSSAGRARRSGEQTTKPTDPRTTSTDDDAAAEPGMPPVDERPPVFIDTDEIEEAIAELVLGATESANERVAPGTPLLLAHEKEAQRVGHHTAKVIGRHAPAGMAGSGNPDLADFVAILITVFRYAWRQVRLLSMLRQQRADGAGDEDRVNNEQPVPAGADPLG